MFSLGCGGLFATPDGIVGLGFVGVAAYVGLASLLEDNAKKSVLPLGRRGRARAAIDDGLDAQFDDLETEAGVREQLWSALCITRPRSG